jgi:competence protein ComEA
MVEQLERYRWLIVALLAVPLLSGVIYLAADRLDDPEPLEIVAGDATTTGDIRVYVTGAVLNPGVYSLPEGSRWIDAIEAAGGPADGADLDAVNLARRVQDEDQIVVPILGGVAVAGATQGPLVNINTASEAELTDLPGIGETRARAIIRSRTEEGPFHTVDELLDRKLIPKSVFEDILDLVTAGP